ncbi:amidase [Hymenobacter daecheongensis DSM 21074]|uniref:Amidase n=1 Tax=Hymenobacter daecheongensis DSM 21074 TaxID=1121955 RepID=A0A1M6F8E8_9BACT|nr:amidase [Hymenobacter daecheongensis]SHI93960.1 amidase [Hymenobacter daecheongensis DSM 21074]
MNRRLFLRNGSLAGVALTTLSLSACAPNAKDPKTAAAGPNENEAAAAAFELDEATIAQLQEKMTSGQHTARSLTELYQKRIAALDKSGPKLNSVIELNPDALRLADALDQERKAGKVRGPLHGIPVLIKDNIDTADQMHTTAGSLALAGHRAAQDAFIIKRLREAGAVLLGKTNLSEWANFRSTRSTSGWSSRGGQTKNPYILDRTPSGSSAGSGTAVAANLCAVAIGTETDGSVVSPSSCCGIVGVKPTVGLLSRSGIIPISATQDTAGPMARTVRDAAVLLGALTGEDPADAVTKESAGKIQPDYTVFLKADALRGKRLGVEKNHLQGSSEAVALLLAALEVLKAQGATIVEVDVDKQADAFGEAEYDVLLYEFKDGVNKYLATANAPVKTLADVMTFNTENKAKAMPFFQQEILEASNKLEGLSSPKFQAARRKSHEGARQLLDGVLRKNQLAAIVAITTGPARCIDLINGDGGGGPGFSSPAAMAGYPHVTVPMGQAHGLPVGLSFVGGPYAEGPLLGLAYAYEQASKKRVKPEFRGPFVG